MNTNDNNYIDLTLEDNDNPEDNVLTDPLSLFFQEIELAVQMAPESIWGVKESINLSRYVFNRYVSITQIRNEILTYVNKNCAHAEHFQYTTSIQLINNNGKDLLYIKFIVYVDAVNGSTQEYIQKFLIGH